ncbi:hypothetical protein GHT07_02135 [Caenimonas koreensis DSM 17982]|uniref:Ankyrin repeat-containing protein n=2 Tax=Caenimonas TaxID=763439 RepID=A0A844AYC0_9BURK|nr:hypothetical protein [Caenimonas koreensis DSM 17982]
MFAGKMRPMKKNLKPLPVSYMADKYGKHVEFVGLPIRSANQVGAFDDTILRIAAFAGQIDDVAVLLDCGAEIDAIGDLGNTPIHLAVLAGQLDVALYLPKRGANARIENDFGETPFDVARIVGSGGAAAALAQAGAGQCGSNVGAARLEDSDAAALWADFRRIHELNFEDLKLMADTAR